MNKYFKEYYIRIFISTSTIRSHDITAIGNDLFTEPIITSSLDFLQLPKNLEINTKYSTPIIKTGELFIVNDECNEVLFDKEGLKKFLLVKIGK